ncbi:MAG: FAD-dependent oxidoreductase [Parachlamydiales bacterium]|jgi:hypothetical protein
MKKPSILIIGAGITGLTAAFFAMKRIPGAQITILEADHRVGGRVLTIDKIELGGETIYCTPDADEMFSALKLDKIPGLTGDRELMGNGDPISLIPTLAMMQEVPEVNESLCQFLERVRNFSAKDIIRSSLSSIFFAYDAEQLSADFAKFRMIGAGRLLKNEFPWVKPEEGMEEFAIKMAEYLQLPEKGGKIILGCKVQAIQVEDDKVTVQTDTHENFTADFIIVTAPPAAVINNHINIEPELPKDLINAFDHIKMANLGKLLIKLEKPKDIKMRIIFYPEDNSLVNQMVVYPGLEYALVAINFSIINKFTQNEFEELIKKAIGNFVGNFEIIHTALWDGSHPSGGGYPLVLPEKSKDGMRVQEIQNVIDRYNQQSKAIFFAGDCVRLDYYGLQACVESAITSVTQISNLITIHAKP